MLECETLDLIGIGVSVWDSICLVPSLPAPGEVVRAERLVEGIGGGVTVAIAMASRLGCRAGMVDCVGDDSSGKAIMSRLNVEAVNTDLMQVLPGGTTSVASIWSDSRTAERTIVFVPGTACDKIKWQEAIFEAVAKARVLHLNGRHPEICHAAVEVAKANRTLVSFDGGAYRYRDEVVPLMRASDVVIVARQFAESHFEAVTKRAAVRQNLAALTAFMAEDLRCEVVGVTDGARGSHFVSSAGKSFDQPAIGSDEALDTTGCGDTFHGAFLAGMCQGQDWASCAQLAAEVSGKNAAGVGGLSYQPSGKTE
ncbi:carbohydrate kinase family protein [Rhodopirellula sp. MGV]|uniref:carbohydrate kinase family protein n=1 Tax=Rhodopirellula sp. MGV TaxID=2023130 RepID=UPI0013040155|nr:carbohydrate kinase family protein [Rhodopirellula sp. MGV]